MRRWNIRGRKKRREVGKQGEGERWEGEGGGKWGGGRERKGRAGVRGGEGRRSEDICGERLGKERWIGVEEEERG